MIHSPEEKRANWLAIHRKRQQKYLNKLKEICLHHYGNRCQYYNCTETTKLEFAHLEPTGVKGAGRGKQTRLLDVHKNFDKYTLLCHKHHHELDHPNKKCLRNDGENDCKNCGFIYCQSKKQVV